MKPDCVELSPHQVYFLSLLALDFGQAPFSTVVSRGQVLSCFPRHPWHQDRAEHTVGPQEACTSGGSRKQASNWSTLTQNQ